MSQSTIASVGNRPNAGGACQQPGEFWDPINSLWWNFGVRATSTTTLYSSSSPDGVTWTDRATATLAAATTDGRNFAVTPYVAGGVMCVHFCYTHSSATSHLRATISGTTVTYGSSVTDSSTGSVVTPAGNSGCVDGSGYPMDGVGGGKNGDFAIGGASNADAGTSWSTGFGTVKNVESGTNNISSSALVPLANGYVAAFCDDAAGASPPVTLEQVHAGKLLNSAGTITNTTSGAWTNVFTALGTAQNSDTWNVCRLADSDVHCVLASGTNTWTHKRLDCSAASTAAPSVAAGGSIPAQTFNAQGGVALIYAGTTLYLFAIDSASGNDIVANSWTAAGGWGSWSNVGLASATRNYLSAAYDGASTILLTWTEGSSSPYSNCATLYSLGGGTTALAGNATAEETASGTLTDITRLSGGATVEETAAGTVHAVLTLAGGATVEETATGTLTEPAVLSGAASVEETASGAVKSLAVLAGGATVDLTAAGGLKLTTNLHGTATVEETAAGQLRTILQLTGTATIDATAGGTLTRTALTALTGTATVEDTATGTLRTVARLAGTATLEETASGRVLVIVRLTGTAHEDLTATGALTIQALPQPGGVVTTWTPNAAGTLALTAAATANAPAWTAAAAATLTLTSGLSANTPTWTPAASGAQLTLSAAVR